MNESASSEDKLTQEQKRLSRKNKGSGKRNKQRIKVSKVHRKIRNQRKDFNHRTSRVLVDTYDRIVFEDLQIQNMVQNHNLARSISDAGWYQLMQFTKSKAECAWKVVEFVNPRNTSQNCSGCHNQVPKDLSVRYIVVLIVVLFWIEIIMPKPFRVGQFTSKPQF